MTRRKAGERGSVMIEFALILPILLLLILGILDFAKAINYWNDTNQLAADGARFAAVDRNPGEDFDPPVTDFRDFIRLQAETAELQTGKHFPGTADEEDSPSTMGRPLEVCVHLDTNATTPRAVGNWVKVEVKTVYNLIPFLAEKTKFGNVAIRGEAVMRLEQPYSGPEGCDSTL